MQGIEFMTKCVENSLSPRRVRDAHGRKCPSRRATRSTPRLMTNMGRALRFTLRRGKQGRDIQLDEKRVEATANRDQAVERPRFLRAWRRASQARWPAGAAGTPWIIGRVETLGRSTRPSPTALRRNADAIYHFTWGTFWTGMRVVKGAGTTKPAPSPPGSSTDPSHASPSCPRHRKLWHRWRAAYDRSWRMAERRRSEMLLPRRRLNGRFS